MKRVDAKKMHEDARGVFWEVHRNIPWNEVNLSTIGAGATRGGHYHRHTTELIVVLQGECAFEIQNVQTGEREDITCTACRGILIEPFEAHWVTAKSDATLLSLLTVPYDHKSPDVISVKR